MWVMTTDAEEKLGVHRCAEKADPAAVSIGQIIFSILFLAAILSGIISSAFGGSMTPSGLPPRKRYTMRGYTKNSTSLHPRQRAQGKRVAYIRGVGYRHVTPGKRRRRTP